MTKYDYIIVGSGLFGAICARQLTDAKKRVLVIDKNNHIGGICYSKQIDGIEVHHYGPHIFNTSSDIVWKYINNFTIFNRYTHTPKVSYKNFIYSFPINLMTLYQVWGVKTPQEASKKLEEVRIKIPNPQNLEEHLLSSVGEDLYSIFFKGYTEKQWGRECKDLPASIAKRIPIRLEFNENYYYSKHQGIPVNGYTDIFNKLLSGIDVCLNCDFFLDRSKYTNIANKIIYTGCIDQFFDYQFGKLEYRSVYLKNEIHQVNSYQGNALINYTEKGIPYTRITEHKHFMLDCVSGKTIISKEYSKEYQEGDIPSYPINDKKNNQLYEKYLAKSKKTKKVIFGGRLAEYKYYNMDDTILSAFKMIEKEIC